uniref:Uncharacterized protein n=1 Tax=Arundo donax TaxID=35708 RepID=A0A0A9BE49_ARUDO
MARGRAADLSPQRF